MRLLSLYVRSFGKLRDFSYEFTDGFNEIIENNGFGKTTLAAFIKAMFYGYANNKKTDVDQNDFKHYRPLNSTEKFGGWLRFEHSGREFRVERYFGSTQKEHTFKLIEESTGKVSMSSEDDKKVLGVRLFGIDGDAFERCLYLPQRAVAVENNDSFVSRLSNLAENTTEKNNCQKACKALSDFCRNFKLMRGEGGIIGDLEHKKEEKQRLLRQSNDAEATIERLNKKIIFAAQEIEKADVKRQRAEADLSRIEAELTKASSAPMAMRIESQLKDKEREYRSLKERAASIKSPVAPQRPTPSPTVSLVGRMGIGWLVLAVVLAVAGIAATFFFPFVGLPMLAAGIVVAIWRFVKADKEKKTTETQIKENERAYEIAREAFDRECAEVNASRVDIEGRLSAIEMAKKDLSEQLAAIAPDGVKTLTDCYDRLTTERENDKGFIRHLAAEIESNKTQLAEARRELSLRSETFVLPSDVEGEIERIDEDLARARHKYECAKKACDLLMKAKENLTESYLPRLNEAFVKNLSALSDGVLATATVDASFGVKIQQEGRLTETGYLSTGYREICNFALRLALMQCIYGNDLPFVVLDDPFVNYDSRNFSLAKKMLTELSESTQVVYLTCRER